VSFRLANATNARDMGGLVVAGGRVRSGVLFRANALHRLTDEDVSALGAIGLRCLVDFRHTDEISMTGPDRLPMPPPGQQVPLPLFDAAHDVFTTVSAVLVGRAGEESLAGLRNGGGEAAMRGLYRWLVSSPIARDGFAAALRLVATPEALPLLFHCTAGKDRTGWMAALVLSVLGADRHVIFEDYLRTNELNATGTAYVLAAAADRIADPTLLVPLLEARAIYLDEAFAEVDRAYGGLEGYLKDGLGLDDSVPDGIRTNLVEPL
jgi:protein-tyrosine phosphatase